MIYDDSCQTCVLKFIMTDPPATTQFPPILSVSGNLENQGSLRPLDINLRVLKKNLEGQNLHFITQP